MRVAIPTFGSRISPRFDCASNVLIVDLDNGEISGRTEQALSHVGARERIHLLRSMGVELLICGGLRRCDHFNMTGMGIDVVSGRMGEVEDVLRHLQEGTFAFNAVSEQMGRGQGMWGKKQGRRHR